MTATTDDKLGRLAKYLEQEYLKFAVKTGRIGTQQEFARHVGVSQSAMSHYMGGYRLPDKRTVGRMALVLGQDIWEVVGMIPDDENDPMLLYIANVWPTLSHSERESLLKLTKKMLGKPGANN